MEIPQLRECMLQACEAVGEPLCPNGEVLDTASDLITQVQSYLIQSHPVSVGNQLAQWMIQSFTPEQLKPYGILVNPTSVSDQGEDSVSLVLLDEQERRVTQVTTHGTITYRGGANASVFIAMGEARLFGQQGAVVSPGVYLRAEAVDRVLAAGRCEVLVFNCPSIEAREGVKLTAGNSFAETFGDCYVNLDRGARLVSHQTGGEICTGTGAITLLMEEGANLEGKGLVIDQNDLNPAQVDLLIEQMRSIIPVPEGYFNFDRTLDDAKRAFLDPKLKLFHQFYEEENKQSPLGLIENATSVRELADVVLPQINWVLCAMSFAEIAQYFGERELIRHNIFSSVYPMLVVDPEKPIHLFGNMAVSFEGQHPTVFLHEHAMALADGKTVMTGYDHSTGIVFDKAGFVARDQGEGRVRGIVADGSKAAVVSKACRLLLTDRAIGEFSGGSQGLADSPNVTVVGKGNSRVYSPYTDLDAQLSGQAQLVHVADPVEWQRMKSEFLQESPDVAQKYAIKR
ncbi:MAG: hypothetical protein ACI3ZY_01975 [Parabacteroides sp.]